MNALNMVHVDPQFKGFGWFGGSGAKLLAYTVLETLSREDFLATGRGAEGRAFPGLCARPSPGLCSWT